MRSCTLWDVVWHAWSVQKGRGCTDPPVFIHMTTTCWRVGGKGVDAQRRMESACMREVGGLPVKNNLRAADNNTAVRQGRQRRGTPVGHAGIEKAKDIAEWACLTPPPSVMLPPCKIAMQPCEKGNCPPWCDLLGRRQLSRCSVGTDWCTSRWLARGQAYYCCC